jgi:hypothetical protein
MSTNFAIINVTFTTEGACAITPGSHITIKTKGVIPGCRLPTSNDVYGFGRHYTTFRSVAEVVDALRSIPVDIHVIHTTMEKDLFGDYACGYPKKDPEAAMPRGLEDYIAFIVSRGLYTIPS